MIDIVIPYLHSQRRNGLELRYCLRGIERKLTGYNKIWIIGQKPSWLIGVGIIQVNDSPYPRLKENNIYCKILEACKNKEVSEDFLFMNDDHFLLKSFTASQFPYYHRGELYDSMKKNKGSYRATLNHSRRVLMAKDLPTLDFDTHCPIVYNKSKFIQAFEDIDWKIDWGYAIKSVYCGLNGIEGTYMPDCKINNKSLHDIKLRTANREWFSTGSLNDDMEKFLTSVYPKKSKYEI